MRLRGLLSQGHPQDGSREEVTTLSWALADLANYMDDLSKEKLSSEPLLAELEHCYDGASSHAYHRLSESLQLFRWDDEEDKQI